MYWFRGDDPLQLIPWLLVSITWVLGGWLIATHAFRLERRERLVAGLGLGLIGYLWFANLWGHWLVATFAFSLAGVSVLVVGLVFAWRGERPRLERGDLLEWRLLLAGLVSFWLFLRIARGTTLFDEWKNLSLISTMGAGDIPAHFYMNSTFYFAYHYGFQLFGASLMRLGGMLPWSAYDFSKAATGALAILLAYLLGKKLSAHKLGGLVVAFVVTFATGTRYLALLLPRFLLRAVDQQVAFPNIDLPFSQALLTTWADGGHAPYPYLVAFLNGIQSWPRFFAIQAGPSTIALAALFLIWLVAGRLRKPAALAVLAILFSFWALSWEASYALFLVGGSLIGALQIIRQRSLRGMAPLTAALWLSVPVAMLQGGTLTELAREALQGIGGGAAGASLGEVSGFGLRWPPGIPSTQIMDLRLTSPLEVLVAIFEMGPVVLFTPWITVWTWKRFREGDWISGALIASSWVGFVVPIFFTYQTDRDIPRLMAYSLDIWLILLTALLFHVDWGKYKWISQAGVIALALTTFGGLIVSGTSLSYASQAAIGRGIHPLDTYIASELWDKLPPGSEVFDSRQWKAVALTGRLTRAALSTNRPSPEWEALSATPTLQDLRAKGYSYVYVDQGWWRSLSDGLKAGLKAPCVRTLAEFGNPQNEFRRMLDISGCKP